MKLLILTAVRTFEEQVRKILETENVLSYSYTNVTGYRDSTQDSVARNWFATEMNRAESLLFFAFVSEEIGNKVFKAVEELNTTCDLRSKVHIVICPIDKYNSITN
ncbi:MAG TPA: hypothetical protein VFF21_08220 [Flavobacteriaceae bacterium]|nr:hypothetical protein [Flavobacteriaceae bacterium]